MGCRGWERERERGWGECGVEWRVEWSLEEAGGVQGWIMEMDGDGDSDGVKEEEGKGVPFSGSRTFKYLPCLGKQWIGRKIPYITQVR